MLRVFRTFRFSFLVFLRRRCIWMTRLRCIHTSPQLFAMRVGGSRSSHATPGDKAICSMRSTPDSQRQCSALKDRRLARHARRSRHNPSARQMPLLKSRQEPPRCAEGMRHRSNRRCDTCNAASTYAQPHESSNVLAGANTRVVPGAPGCTHARAAASARLRIPRSSAADSASSHN
jgi:hypothetical protein